MPVLKWWVGKGATTGFCLTMIVLLASAWLASRNLNRLVVNDGWVVHTHQVLDALRDLIGALAEAESNQRSYLLTGAAVYLQPYEAAVTGALKHVEEVKNLTRDNPVQQQRVGPLQSLVRARIDSLRVGIATRQSEGAEGAQRYVLAGRGKSQMEKVRGLVGEMEATEIGLLHLRERESSASYQTAVMTQWITTFVGLGLVLAAYILLAQELETRRASAKALARANDELEGRVEERTAALHATNQSLQQSNRELEHFASVASHDLQEPLRKIQAFSDRLQTRFAPELGDQGRDYLARIQASAARMRSLIDALLTFSRVTTKAQPFGPVDLNDTAHEVVADLEDRIGRMNGRVELGALPILEADPLQMRQLFQNLIANGLKFARPGVAPLVQVESKILDGENGVMPCCELTVRDNGIGFEEVYLDRIFELFQRLHGRQQYEGTGMGLAICRKIVERHGGTITARSAPGLGATFVVTLPLRQQPKG